MCSTVVTIQNHLQSRYRQYSLELNKVMGKELVLVKAVGLRSMDDCTLVFKPLKEATLR